MDLTGKGPGGVSLGKSLPDVSILAEKTKVASIFK